MRYDAERALELIPRDLLATVELVNISYVCRCDKRHYMPSLTTEKICRCGRTISFSRRIQVHYMRRDPAVRRQVRAILKRVKAG